MDLEDSPLMSPAPSVSMEDNDAVHLHDLNDFSFSVLHDALSAFQAQQLSQKHDTPISGMSLYDGGDDTGSVSPVSVVYLDDFDGACSVSPGSILGLNDVPDTPGSVSARDLAEQGLGVFILDDDNEPMYMSPVSYLPSDDIRNAPGPVFPDSPQSAKTVTDTTDSMAPLDMAEQGLGIFIVDDNNNPIYMLNDHSTPLPAPRLPSPPRPSGLRFRRPHTPPALNLNLHLHTRFQPTLSPTPAQKSLAANLKSAGDRGPISCGDRPRTPYPSTNTPLSPSQRRRRRAVSPTGPGLLSAGPDGYAFTPLAQRNSSLESLHADHGIVLRKRKWGLWRGYRGVEDAEQVKFELMQAQWARNKEIRFEDEEQGWYGGLKGVFGWVGELGLKSAKGGAKEGGCRGKFGGV